MTTLTSTGTDRAVPAPGPDSRPVPEVVDGGVQTPGPAVDDRTLVVAGIRALLAAGWQQTWCPQEIGLPGGRRYTRRISWDGGVDTSGCRLVWLVWDHPTRGEICTEMLVSSVQQAVDVLSALTGVGTELTTGGRTAMRLLDAVIAQEAEIGDLREQLAATTGGAP